MSIIGSNFNQPYLPGFSQLTTSANRVQTTSGPVDGLGSQSSEQLNLMQPKNFGKAEIQVSTEVPLSQRPLVDANATFPNLEPGAIHKKAARQPGKGYPERQINGPVDWKQPAPNYKPVHHTDPKVEAGPVWADPADPNHARMIRPDGQFQTYEGEVKFSSDGVTPQNPRGRTGIEGRGLLGKWGANYAADPIVTRINPETGLLQMIAIKRGDTKEWAIPGGMVDYGEALSGTLSRELTEEALGKEADPAAAKALESKFKELFAKGGHEVYAGYCDDPRNTDQAWMETKAVHLHLTGEDAKIDLHAEDDADEARWMDLTEKDVSKLYASHTDFVLKAVRDWQQSSGRKVFADGHVE